MNNVEEVTPLFETYAVNHIFEKEERLTRIIGMPKKSL